MNAEKLFHFLIVAAIAAFGLGLGLSFLETEPPEEIVSWFDDEGAGPLLTLMDEVPGEIGILLMLLGIALVIAYAAALIGLLYYKPWSRSLFIILMVIEFLMLPLMGTSYVTPLVDTADALLNTIQGALVVMLLIDPVRGRFKASSP